MQWASEEYLWLCLQVNVKGKERNMTNIECKSYWKKGDKKCIVYGEREMNCIDYTFWISGWNPLPCKEFTGSYSVLANWLKDNGWEREIKNSIYRPDSVFILHH